MSRAAEARDLRSDIRHWRRQRANATLADVLGDLYTAVFSLALFGLIVGNVVLQSRRVFTVACASAGCTEARTSLPWLVSLAGVLLVLVLSRLFGPVFVSPAAATWLLSAPVDRATLLRPRLLAAGAAGLVTGALLTLPAVTLAGFGRAPVVLVSLGAGFLAVAAVAVAARSQSEPGRLAGVLTALVGAAVWTGLLLLALGLAPRATPPARTSALGLVAFAAVILVGLLLLALEATRAGRIRRDRVAPGGSLTSGLSGALATLDLALVYDVLVAHRWRDHPPIRSRRGGPTGPAVLVWSELTRLRRAPLRLVVLAAAAVTPYAAATAGLGRPVILVGALAGFLAGLPFLTGMRVTSRSASITRALPFSDATTRSATMVVPVLLLLGFGLVCAPAVHAALGGTAPTAAGLGVATGVSAVCGATRWVTGRPPDYTRPLVSTPAGGVPTNLYGSVFRGFDILLITSAPLMLWPDPTGVLVSLGLGAIVLAYLTSRA